MSTPFLMWYDDRPKATINAKIADALARFYDRFGVCATVALISSDDLPVNTNIEGISIRVVQTIRRNTVWVGRE